MKKEASMTYDAAKKIVGNQSKHMLRNMIKALSLHSWRNTPEEQVRLEAAKIVSKGR